MRTKNFTPFIVVLLLAVLATIACGSSPSSDGKTWKILVWAGSGGGLTRFTTYYCESYNVDDAGTLVISGCGSGNSTKTFSASQKWEISLRE